jgi:hypothetical protein
LDFDAFDVFAGLAIAVLSVTVLSVTVLSVTVFSVTVFSVTVFSVMGGHRTPDVRWTRPEKQKPRKGRGLKTFTLRSRRSARNSHRRTEGATTSRE